MIITEKGIGMKRKICRTVSLLLTFILLFAGCPFAIPTVGAISAEELTASAAILVESTTGKVLFEKNSHEIRPCASITKLMTLLLVFEALESGKISYDDVVVASEHAAGMGGSDIWLKEGEKMSVYDMIKATAVASANDAATALAEYIGGTEEAFVEKMNTKAKQLGMNDTVFKNCNGLDEDGHVTSAYDVAIMSCEVMKHEEIFEFTSIWLDYLRDGATQIVNTNKLLKSYKGITGLKTGTTNNAGACISASAERNGLSLVAVVLNSKSGKERFTDAQKLLDYGFAEYTMLTPEIPEELASPVEVGGGMEKLVYTQADVNNELLVKKGEEKKVSSEIVYREALTAPISKGEQVGSLEFKIDGETIAEYPITAQNSIEEINFKAVLRIIVEYFLKL